MDGAGVWSGPISQNTPGRGAPEMWANLYYYLFVEARTSLSLNKWETNSQRFTRWIVSVSKICQLFLISHANTRRRASSIFCSFPIKTHQPERSWIWDVCFSRLRLTVRSSRSWAISSTEHLAYNGTYSTIHRNKENCTSLEDLFLLNFLGP